MPRSVPERFGAVAAMVTPTDPRTALRVGLSVTGPHSENTTKGIVMVLFALLLFASMDVMAKHLMQSLNVTVVMASRYIVGALILLVMLPFRHGPASFRIQRWALVLLRSIAMAAGSFCAASALKLMPIAETTALLYLSPFGVLLLSGLILGEKVRPVSWVAAAGSFVGLLLITRPGGGLNPVGVGFALASAGLSVWYFLSSRLLARTETTIALLFYANLTGAILFGAMLVFDGDVPMPGFVDSAMLLAIAVFGLVGHFFLTAAYREAPASLIAPLLYAHIVYGGILGWLFFGYVPDPYSALGICVVAGSGAGLAIYNRVTERRSRG